jgi:hypothetical protein
MAATETSDPARRFGDLRTRVLSASAAAAVGLTLLYLGGVWTMLLVALVTGAMIWEYRAITLTDPAQGSEDAARADVPFLLAGGVGGVLVAEV